MDYKIIHDKIICNAIKLRGSPRSLHSAKGKMKGKGFHIHHILPRSLGGGDRGDNLVILTPREHFVIHHLLWKMHGGKMAVAFRFMCVNMDNAINSRTYEKLLAQVAIDRTNNDEWKANCKAAAEKKAKDPEWLRKNRESVKKTTKSPEWKESHRLAIIKRSKNETWLKNTRAATKAVVKTEKWINNRRAGIDAMKLTDKWADIVSARAKKMVKNKAWIENKRILEIKFCKPCIGISADGVKVILIGTKEKIDFGVNPSDISSCLSGRQKTSKGYAWRLATRKEVELLRPDHEWLKYN